MIKKKKIIEKYRINYQQEKNLQNYLDELVKNNSHTNLVGKTTLIEPWRTHILDSLQLLPFIENKTSSILDMGSGAGLPGIVLAIAGYSNVTLVDSNGKKINFLQKVSQKLNLKINIILNRLEKIYNYKFDIITSRALSNLDKLFSYSQNFIKTNTVLIFLKGKTVNDEIITAKKKWSFSFEIYSSESDIRGCVLIITKLKKKNDKNNINI